MEMILKLIQECNPQWDVAKNVRSYSTVSKSWRKYKSNGVAKKGKHTDRSWKTSEYQDRKYKAMFLEKRKWLGGDKVIWQDDNASYHRAKRIKVFPQQNHIKWMKWPEKCLDLNPIKNSWWKYLRNSPKGDFINQRFNYHSGKLELLWLKKNTALDQWNLLKFYCLVWFYGISIIVGYLMPNPVLTYILSI